MTANCSMSKITSTDIRSALLNRFPAQEYAVMFEVADGTGASAKRYADAVVMSLWPSRGLELHGIEIKVSRSDYRREAADPAKAESVARFCDRWSVYTAPGVIGDIGAVPPAWGVEEFDGKAFKTLKPAEKTPAEPLTRTFIASMLRRADGISRGQMREIEDHAKEAAEKAVADERAAIEHRIAKGVEDRTKALSKMAEARQRLIEMTGFDLASAHWQTDHFWGAVPLAVKLYQAGMNADGYHGMDKSLADLAKQITECRAIVAGLVGNPPADGGGNG